MTNDEKKYLEAKQKYYSGEPIMSDEEFDLLESKLKKKNSNVINVVGYAVSSSGQKFNHLSKMLSLAKIKAKVDTEPPIEEFKKWIKKTNATLYTVEPKFDGNACNVIYKEGKLFKALTRGDGIEGIDITHVLKYHVPNEISDISNLEVRGEVLINKKTFEEKYSEYKNPRNYVAGILHRDDTTEESVNDLCFVPFEVKIQKDNDFYFANTYEWLAENNFAKAPFYFAVNFLEDLDSKFDYTFNEMLNYRNNISQYLLDGFVCKVWSVDDRIRIGENSHDPGWALAVKFSPEGVIATIDHIDWRLSKKKELIPIGILEPIELDGTTVSRVSLYNYKFCIENFLDGVKGAEVELIKFGEIIPGIVKVVYSPNSGNDWVPKECPSCGGSVKIGDIHIICENDNCSGGELKKFVFGAKQLNLEQFGDKTLEKIFNCGLRNPLHILDLDDDWFGEHGFGYGRTVEILLEQINKVNEITLEQVFLTLGVDDLGETLSKQLAKWYANIEYSFKGLQKNIINNFVSHGSYYKLLQDQLEFLEYLKINVIYPEKIINQKEFQYIELTGSPKGDGFLTKEDFLNYAYKFGFKMESLSKKSSYLLTDSYESSSNKMNKARKLQVEIITYTDFLKKYK